ncbi:hypothetical protein SAMN05216535_2380 [Stutzerimonas xanthomarina]|uniref:Uncharacterized protein n=2 Tax=Stutzerimonas xanthomarina TaxID=271420 RepID=A0A1M5MR91_9GAMM|nr:hypothetical protein SAMN05216535_2380 [Stutzerimonas xanthomarina]SHG79737.1 hypothetical protein SAMN02744645_1437 [Stutzerimonas xanthomarina DSM 18231]
MNYALANAAQSQAASAVEKKNTDSLRTQSAQFVRTAQ